MIPFSIDEEQIPLLHGANAKFSVNINAASPDDPYPVSATAITAASFSADDKAAIGNDVSLGVSASTSVTLAFSENSPDVETRRLAWMMTS